ncbi:MAG: hypothetical protein PHN44_07280 [Candidatus Marinimicrobia bacterium]|nr:hypothetical protein [Candidatus Neomarinimicrobiota bacterium]
MIYWDLDNVLRDLCKPVWGRDAVEWFEKKDGMSFVEYLNAHPEILTDAPPTQYLSVALGMKNLHIWTATQTNWIEPTWIWIKNHIGLPKIEFFSSGEEKLKRLQEDPTDYLIEDSPNFSDYSQIILIDKPYNGHIDAHIRVGYADFLKTIIDSHMSDSWVYKPKSTKAPYDIYGNRLPIP